MKKLRALLLINFLASSSASSFAFSTGHDLLRLMQSPQGVESAKGYFYGALDTYYAGINAEVSHNGKTRPFMAFCIPGNVTKLEAFNAFSDSLKTSFIGSAPAPVVINVLLGEKWPCKQ